MTRRNPWSIVAGVLRVVAAVPLAVAGAVKLADPAAAAGTLAGGGGEAVTLAVAAAELALAAWLFSGIGPAAAAWVAAGVYLAFAGVVAAELAAEVPRLCGCFGGGAAEDPESVRRGLWLALGRNLALAAVATLAARAARPVAPDGVPAGAALA